MSRVKPSLKQIHFSYNNLLSFPIINIAKPKRYNFASHCKLVYVTYMLM